MDASAVQAIVDQHLDHIRKELWLYDWQITVDVGPMENPSWGAMCNREGADYNKATITIDPARHFNERQVLNSLVHELLHITLARMDVYRDSITSLIPGVQHDDGTSAMESRLWTHAIEQCVLSLERGVARRLWDLPDSPSDEPPVK